MNVSQNHCSTSVGCAPCLTPTGVFWVGQRARLLVGAEAIRLQGIYLSRDLERRFPAALLQDLAGNSFSTPAFSASFICALSVLAQLWEGSWKKVRFVVFVHIDVSKRRFAEALIASTCRFADSR